MIEARVTISDPKSEFYRGPTSEAPYVLEAYMAGRSVFIEFDTIEDFPGALTRSGVELHRIFDGEASG